MRKIQTLISRVERHSVGVYSVYLDLDGHNVRFKAGQFLHLALEDYDPSGGYWPESRVFSICSRPGLSEVRIIYSVKGSFTSQMEKELKVGRKVWIKIPLGEFVIVPNANDSIVLVAGGTGISPFIPFIESLDVNNIMWKSLTVFYGVRSSDQLIFSSLLSKQEAAIPQLRVNTYVENDASGNQISGRIDSSQVALAGLVPGAKVYVSGPPSMIQYHKDNLVKRGIPQNQIFIDSWE